MRIDLRAKHQDTIYSCQPASADSWYEEDPRISLDDIQGFQLVRVRRMLAWWTAGDCTRGWRSVRVPMI